MHIFFKLVDARVVRALDRTFAVERMRSVCLSFRDPILLNSEDLVGLILLTDGRLEKLLGFCLF